MQTQKCKKCGQIFDLTEDFFHKKSKSKTGFNNICKECINIRRRLWVDSSGYEEPSFFERCNGDEILARAKVMYSGIVSRSREKGFYLDKNIINVDFLYNWLLTTSDCECCKKSFDFSFKGTNNYLSPTVDRFDPNIGYNIENIHLLCWRCNILKKDSSLDKLEKVLLWMMKK